MSARPLRARVFGIAFSFGLAIVAGSSALTFNVNSVEDDIDFDTIDIDCETAPGNGICTLRAAVMQADVMPSDSTIIVPPGTYFLERLPTGGNGADTGDLNLTAPNSGNPVITISGSGAASTIIDANQLDRVFQVHAHRTASISGVALRNGFVGNPYLGGGILNEGALTLSGCVLMLNRALNGGGIFNLFAGDLVVDRCTIAKNNASEGQGGGIFNNGEMTLTHSAVRDNDANFGGGIYSAYLSNIDQCTISGNSALTEGAGVYNNEGDVFLSNSTISGNKSLYNGGGILNKQGAFWTYNATIAFNEADADVFEGGSGGGVFNADAFYPRNTIIAGNTHSGSLDFDDCKGTAGVFGHSWFGTLTGCTPNQGTPAAEWDEVVSLAELGPLRSNGGSTMTHALQAGSTMINSGFACIGLGDPTAIDQRGGVRGQFPLTECDAGAYEYGALPAGLIFADGFELGNLWAWG